MNVIKESHASVMRRKQLEQEKRKIMEMDFDKKKNRQTWKKLNQFLSDRQSDISAATAFETRESPNHNKEFLSHAGALSSPDES